MRKEKTLQQNRWKRKDKKKGMGVKRANENKGGEVDKSCVRKAYEMGHEGQEKKKKSTKKMQVITAKDTW